MDDAVARDIIAKESGKLKKSDRRLNSITISPTENQEYRS